MSRGLIPLFSSTAKSLFEIGFRVRWICENQNIGSRSENRLKKKKRFAAVFYLGCASRLSEELKRIDNLQCFALNSNFSGGWDRSTPFTLPGKALKKSLSLPDCRSKLASYIVNPKFESLRHLPKCWNMHLRHTLGAIMMDQKMSITVRTELIKTICDTLLEHIQGSRRKEKNSSHSPSTLSTCGNRVPDTETFRNKVVVSNPISSVSPNGPSYVAKTKAGDELVQSFALEPFRLEKSSLSIDDITCRIINHIFSQKIQNEQLFNLSFLSNLPVLSRIDQPQTHFQLNEEQERIVKFAEQGYNIYLGGSAGTGKTCLLRAICEKLRQNRVCVLTTSSTGISAKNLGGDTLHHAFGYAKVLVSPSKEKVMEDTSLPTSESRMDEENKSPSGTDARWNRSKARFLRVSSFHRYDTIIIDEISMISKELLETFEQEARTNRKSSLPFGGLQIILSGDILQLPCVEGTPVFQSSLLQASSTAFIRLKLTYTYRQRHHAPFRKDLDCLRIGDVASLSTPFREKLLYSAYGEEKIRAPCTTCHIPRDASQINTFESSSSSMVASGSCPTVSPQKCGEKESVKKKKDPLFLCATNEQAVSKNAERLADLPGEAKQYEIIPLPTTLSGFWTDYVVISTKKSYCKVIFSWVPLLQRQFTRVLKAFSRKVNTEIGSEPLCPKTIDPGSLKENTLNFVPEVVGERIFRQRTGSQDRSPRLSLRLLHSYTPDSTEIAFRGRIPSHTMRLRKTLTLQLRSLVEELAMPVEKKDFSNKQEFSKKPAQSSLYILSSLVPESCIMYKLRRLCSRHSLSVGKSLKYGCRVMIRVNLSLHIKNGTIGVVIGFAAPEAKNLNPSLAHINHHVKHLVIWRAQTSGQPLPVVQFPDGSVTMIPPVIVRVGGDAFLNYHEAQWMTLPLLLAYALTIHKAQGLNLKGDVHVDFFGAWKCYHLVYVALSRVSTLEQLSFSHFDESFIQVQLDAVNFEHELQNPHHITLNRELPKALWWTNRENRLKLV